MRVGDTQTYSVSGTYEIRHTNGSLVLTKGDVRLLTAPLAAPPTAVYLEGDKLLLRELKFQAADL